MLYKSKLPEYVAVRDIVIHPKTNDLVLATHGRGIFIVDDISPMRRLNADLLQKDVALLPTRPVAVTGGHYGCGLPEYRFLRRPECHRNHVGRLVRADRPDQAQARAGRARDPGPELERRPVVPGAAERDEHGAGPQ